MLNVSIIMGRLTKDPEIKATNSGKAVALFTLAVERDFKNSEGKRETDFINCVAYGDTAEFVKVYMSKGSMAICIGRIQVRNYTDKDGNKRYVTEIICEKVNFGESKKDAGKAVDVQYTEPEDADWGTLPF